jgi:hypothetical protein
MTGEDDHGKGQVSAGYFATDSIVSYFDVDGGQVLFHKLGCPHLDFSYSFDYLRWFGEFNPSELASGTIRRG